jgi:hypothetical protein
MTNLLARLRRTFSRDNLPRSRPARIAIGVLLVLCGLAGFLPILGFWMVPAGLTILAIDIPAVRRFTRRVGVFLGRWWKKFRPGSDPAKEHSAQKSEPQSDLPGRSQGKAHTPS